MDLLSDSFKKNRKIFWDKIERELDVSVPKYLKNILLYQLLDNFITMPSLKDGDFMEIEEYVKSVQYKNQIANDADLSDYYGFYSKNPENFKFSFGDRQMLLAIVRITKNKDLCTKSDGESVSAIDTVKSQILNMECLNYQSTFLNVLLRSAVDNSDKKKQGYRYPKHLTLISCFFLFNWWTYFI